MQDHGDWAHFFCSATCRDAFRDAPDQYAQDTRRMVRRHSITETDMRTTLKYALLAAAIGLMPLTAQAQTYERSGWGYGGDWGWGFGHMAFGGLTMLLVWGGIIVLIVLAIRWLGTGSSGASGWHPPRKSPRQILEERFARGEIDKDEFEERKRLLSD